jgi:hypothetical protein
MKNQVGGKFKFEFGWEIQIQIQILKPQLPLRPFRNGRRLLLSQRHQSEELEDEQDTVTLLEPRAIERSKKPGVNGHFIFAQIGMYNSQALLMYLVYDTTSPILRVERPDFLRYA